MYNKSILFLVGSVLIPSSVFAGSSIVNEVITPIVRTSPNFEGNVSVGAHSDYIFRGSRRGIDLVDSAVNFSKSALGIDFTAGAWYGSYEKNDDNVDELDLTFGISKDLGFARFSTGYIHYDTDSDSGKNDGTTAEVYFEVSKDFRYDFSSSLTYFIDVSGELSSDEGDNQGYVEFSFSKSNLFFEGFRFSNDLGYFIEKGALSHNTTRVSYDYSLISNVTITPYIAYTFELDRLEQHRFIPPAPVARVGHPERNRFHGGLVLTINF